MTGTLSVALVLVLSVICNLVVAQGLPIPVLKKPFGELPNPPAPDYAQRSSWAALPDRSDAADVVPENDPFGDRQASAAVDVFYIHPTTYRETAYWNQPIDDAKTNAWTDASVIARQAAVFNACCRVYAPRYRQASAAGVYAPPEMKAAGAYDLAWEDVRAAFEHYLKNWNQGRPFIIAGHSQGAAHTFRWLETYGGDAKLRARLVAAYPVGIALPGGLVDRVFHGIPVCKTADATACILSWNTFEQGGDASAMLKGSLQRFEMTYGSLDPQTAICVNPLSFSSDKDAAPATWNLGALPATTPQGRLPATEAGRLGARCESGVLFVDAPPAEGYAIVPLPGKMLHFNDFDLFYQNIRANAVARADAYIAAQNRKDTAQP